MMNRQDAGRIGGLATVAKHGRDHMHKIGRKGAAAFWKRYTLRPVDIAAFAIIERATGRAIGVTNCNRSR